MGAEKLFVTGFGGQLGTDIARQAAGRWEVLAAYHTKDVPMDVRKVRLDITDREKVRQAIADFRPDIVLHAASLTNVDQCEREPELARKVNADATKTIADACKEVGAFLGYISTDFVFDGAEGNYYEEHAPRPLNVYGETKLSGEQHVRAAGGLIARTAVLYSPNPSTFNFGRWVISELRAGRNIRVVTDQVCSPSLSSNVARAVLELCGKLLGGTFHVAGREGISRHDFAVRAARVFGLDSRLIQPITTSQLGQLARRPRNATLNVSKASSRLTTRLLGVDEGLREFRREMGL